jgi:hypothetical protein
MTRTLFAAALLLTSAPAFACAGGKCGDECSKPAAKTETAAKPKYVEIKLAHI